MCAGCDAILCVAAVEQAPALVHARIGAFQGAPGSISRFYAPVLISDAGLFDLIARSLCLHFAAGVTEPPLLHLLPTHPSEQGTLCRTGSDPLNFDSPSCCCCYCMQTPVWRQLYTEKQVVAEERRTRTDNAPMGKFQVGANVQR